MAHNRKKFGRNNRSRSTPNNRRRQIRIFRFDRIFKRLNLFPGAVGSMRRNLRDLMTGASIRSNESWLKNFLAMANRWSTTRRAGSVKSQRNRSSYGNFADYQTLETRVLLAANIEWLNTVTVANEAGPDMQEVPTLVVSGGVLASNVTVNLSPTGGTATGGGVDFTLMNITIPAADYTMSQNFDLVALGRLAIQSDRAVEGDENLTITMISPNPNLTVVGSANALHTIHDDDFASINFSTGTSSRPESTGSHEVKATLNITPIGNFGTTRLDRNVSFNISDTGMGTATGGGADYSFTNPQTLQFVAGTLHGAQTPTGAMFGSIVNDTLVEGDQTVVLGLDNLVDGTTGQVTLGDTLSSHTFTITDTDTASVTMTVDTNTVDEGDDVTVTLTLNTDPGHTLEKDLDVDLSAALVGMTSLADYSFVTTQVTFGSGAGNTDTQQLLLTAEDDLLVEGDQDIDLSVDELDDNFDGQVTVTNMGAETITITDTDTASVTMTIDTDTVDEGDDVTVTLTLNTDPMHTLEKDLDVDLSAALVGTTSLADYSFATTQVTFTAGSTDSDTQTLTLSAEDDLLVEGDQDIDLSVDELDDDFDGQVTVTNMGAETITITDTDTASVTMTIDSNTVDEGDDVTVTLTLNTDPMHTLEKDLDVDLSAALVGTTSLADYSFGTTQVTFTAGSTDSDTQTLTLSAEDDLLVEGDQDINLSVDELDDDFDGQVTVTNMGAETITITDTDTASVTMTINSNTVDEGDDVTVTLTLNTDPMHTLEKDLDVDLSAALVGTTSLADYSFGTTQVTFGSGAGDTDTQQLMLTAEDDLLIEGDQDIDLSVDELDDDFDGQVTVTNMGAETITITDTDTASVTMTINTDTVDEGDDVTVTLTLNTDPMHTLEKDLDVDLSAALVGTTSLADYSFGTTQVTFTAGSTDSDTQTLTLSAEDDLLIEGDQDIDLSVDELDDDFDGQVTVTNMGAETITITDTDTASVTMTINTDTVDEGDDVTVTLTLNTDPMHTLEKDLDVDLSAALVGTTSLADYSFGTTQVTFGSGAGDTDTQQLTLTAEDDLLVEGDQDIDLSVDELDDDFDGQVTVTNMGAETITITDTDTASVTMTIDTDTVDEGDDVTVTLTLNTDPMHTLEKDLDVDLSAALVGTTSLADYSFGTTQVTFTAGSTDSDTQTLTLSAEDDLLVEGNQDIDLSVDELDDDFDGQVTVTNMGAETITITDTDTASVTMTINTDTVDEGDDVTVTLTLNTDPMHTLEKDLDVDLSAALVGTTSLADYSFGTTQVTFTAGSTDSATQTLILSAEDDLLVEGDQDIDLSVDELDDDFDGQVTVTNMGAETITITDTDTASVTMTINTDTVDEGDDVTVTLTLNTDPMHTLEKDLDVDLSAALVGTTSLADYSFGTTQVTFTAGSTDSDTQTLTLSAEDDLLIEGDQDIDLSVDELDDDFDGQVTVTNMGAETITITDTDTASVTMTINTDTVDEGDDVTVTLTLNTDPMHTLEKDLDVDLSAALVGTTSLADYSFGTTQVTFTAGSTDSDTQTLILSAEDDLLVEGDQDIDLSVDELDDDFDGQVTVTNMGAETITISDTDTASVTMTIDTDTVAEGDDVTVTLTLNTDPMHTLEKDLDVDLSAALVGTTSLADYSFGTTQVTFTAGSTDSDTQTLILSAEDDLLVEGDQDIDLSVDELDDDFDGQVTVTNMVAETITITDTDTASVTMTVEPTVSEGSTATVTLTLNMPAMVTLEKNLVVDLTSAGVDALPADFLFPADSVTFLAGSGNGSQKTLTITATNDNLVEGDQDVDVSVDTLADDFDGQVSVTNAGSETITIIDTDTATVTMSVDASVNEGSDATVTLTLNMPGAETLEKNLVVDLTSAGVDALPADFSFPTTFVTFLAGEGNGTQKTLALSAQDDDLVEGDQDVEVSVDTLVDDFDGQVSVTNAGAETTTIVDVDSATVTLTVDPSIDEGSDATVTLTLNTPGAETLEKDLTIDLTSAGVDALPADFSFPTTFVTFLAGEGNGTQKTLILAAQNDDLVEGDQDVDVSVDTLADDFDGQVSVTNTGAETITIVDLDSATVTLTVDPSTSEGSDATVTLTLNTPGAETLEKDLTIDLTSAGVDALPADFSFPTTFVTFLAGEGNGTQKTLTLAAQNDDLVEGDQDVEVSVDTLADDFDGQVSVTNAGAETITIVDLDSATVTMTIDLSINEGSDATVTLTLNMPGAETLEKDLTIDLTSTGVDALPADFSFPTTFVTFLAGEGNGTQKTLTLAAQNDDLVEGDQDVEVSVDTLADDFDGQVSVTNAGAETITIVDVDSATVTLTIDPSVNEGSDATVTLTLNMPGAETLEKDLTIDLTSAGIDALPADFSFPTTFVTFLAGEGNGTQKTLTLAAQNDDLVEGDQDVEVSVDTLADDFDGQVSVTNAGARDDYHRRCGYGDRNYDC